MSKPTFRRSSLALSRLLTGSIVLSVLLLSACDNVNIQIGGNSDDTNTSSATTKTSSTSQTNKATVIKTENRQIKITPIDNQEIRLGQRVALLIANSNYQEHSPLNNPINDAQLLANTLHDLGFTVTIINNSDKKNMLQAIGDFTQNAKDAESAVFYFSGHGMQDSSRVNYLLPVDANISSELGIKSYGINTFDIIDALEKVKPRASLVVFDACRDNPFLKVRGSKGLADMNINTDSQMLITYATRSGKYAQDASKASEINSPYALAISDALKQAETESLLTLFDDVASNVYSWTDGSQKPTRSGDMRVDTMLVLKDNNENIPNLTKPEVKYESTKPTTNKANEHFTVINDGTVIDNTTNMMWMRCSLGQEWDGADCIGQAQAYSWTGAVEAVRQLNEIGYAGYSDWQLPQIEDFSQLIYCSSGFDKTTSIPKKSGGNMNVKDECKMGGFQKPTIDLNVFPNTQTWYWSASSENEFSAWIVHFSYGYNDRYQKSDRGYVRPVRSVH